MFTKTFIKGNYIIQLCIHMHIHIVLYYLTLKKNCTCTSVLLFAVLEIHITQTFTMYTQHCIHMYTHIVLYYLTRKRNRACTSALFALLEIHIIQTFTMYTRLYTTLHIHAYTHIVLYYLILKRKLYLYICIIVCCTWNSHHTNFYDVHMFVYNIAYTCIQRLCCIILLVKETVSVLSFAVLEIHIIQTFTMYTCLYATLHIHVYTDCVVLSYS